MGQQIAKCDDSTRFLKWNFQAVEFVLIATTESKHFVLKSRLKYDRYAFESVVNTTPILCFK